MVIYDYSGNIITNPDLTNGYLRERQRIKESATPIDDITKFAWDKDDYETYYEYISNNDVEKLEQAKTEVMHALNKSDYIACKVVDNLVGCSTVTEILDVLSRFKIEYGTDLTRREEARRRVNELNTAIVTQTV